MVPVALAMLLTTRVTRAELVMVPAKEMSGIETWKEGQSWGAGNFHVASDTPLTRRVDFEGGDYAVYARVFTSPATDAALRLRIDGRSLLLPMQAKVGKLGWVRVASVAIPRGTAEIRVEAPPSCAGWTGPD